MFSDCWVYERERERERERDRYRLREGKRQRLERMCIRRGSMVIVQRKGKQDGDRGSNRER